ncbi:TmcC family electron transfer complex membrane anchor subunit [Thermodesulfobacteriota bacterium]
MYGIYNFVSGPMVWLTFIIFLLGSVYRVYALFDLTLKKERFILSFMSLKYSLRSIIHWIIPFGSLGWRSQPVLTIVTFAFHISLFITPLFLMSHVIILNEGLGISWATVSDSVADIMTLIVLIGAVFFTARRIIKKDVRFITSANDFLLIGIVIAPFVTGFIAYHQFFAYRFMMVLHIVSGEIMLMAIPFTRLSHMLLSPLTRAYMGSEFGNVRHARDY